MEIEVGKKYWTNDGRAVTALYEALPGMFAMYEEGKPEGVFCDKEGKPCFKGFDRWEIIAEWEEPATPDAAFDLPMNIMRRNSCAVSCVYAGAGRVE